MATSVNNDFISQIGLNGASSEKQAALLAQMAEIIQKRLALRVMMLLPEKALRKLLTNI